MSLTDNIVNEMPEGCRFITATLKPQLYRRTIRKQFLLTVQGLKMTADIYMSYYIIVPELTKANNIHYHIIAKFRDDMPFAEIKFQDCMKLSKNIGIVHINDADIIDKVRTVEYLFKDYNKTKSLINLKKDELDIILHRSKPIRFKKPRLIMLDFDENYYDDFK